MYTCTQAHQQAAAAVCQTVFPVEIRQNICIIYTRTSIHVLMCFLFCIVSITSVCSCVCLCVYNIYNVVLCMCVCVSV